jgi:hypothetical protein
VHRISDKRGNGQWRREVWENAKGEVTHYNLAYVNHALFKRDNGRVVGYDNQHGYHHRHYFGKVSAVAFTSFEEPADLLRVLTSARLDLFRAILTQADSITGIATRLQRDRSAVKRDVDELALAGLISVE